MAGSELSGFTNASEKLFEGCTWVLCPTDGERVPATLAKLIVDVGAHQTIVCSPEEHDRAVAAISHSVQVGSSSLAAAVDRIIEDSDLPWMLAANGWKDTTRIAESNPDMWVPVLIENRENVLPLLKEIESRVNAMHEALASQDSEKVRSLLTEGRQARENWSKGRTKST